MKKALIIIIIIIIIIIPLLLIVNTYIKNNKKYYNSDFNIKTYTSSIDKDNDGIDDQTDILNNTKKYHQEYYH